MRWTGVLFIAGKKSHRAPLGARGHKILLLPSAVELAVRDLPGKPLWMAKDARSHSPQIEAEVGVIEECSIVGDMVVVSGEMYSGEEELLTLAASGETLGMSFDANECRCVDTCSEIWEIDRAAFLGAHIMVQSKAAHHTDTLFWIE